MPSSKITITGSYENDSYAIGNAINNLADGKVAEIKEITLDPYKSSTVFNDTRCSSSSLVHLAPSTANSAALTGVYVITTNGSFEVFYSQSSETDLKFKYIIFN
jgi:hypothetical protein